MNVDREELLQRLGPGWELSPGISEVFSARHKAARAGVRWDDRGVYNAYRYVLVAGQDVRMNTFASTPEEAVARLAGLIQEKGKALKNIAWELGTSECLSPEVFCKLFNGYVDRLKLTDDDLAKLFGADAVTVSKWKSGRATPTGGFSKYAILALADLAADRQGHLT